MSQRTRSLVGIAVVSLWLSASPASAQVSCANPDNLCTGDPCEITLPIAVISPCVVDFGARTLVIRARVQVPNDGVLSFTAAAIDGFADIDGRHLEGGSGSGGEIELHASAGSVTLRGEIDVSGTLDTGSIVVTATGDILLDDRLDAKAVGASAAGPGGDVTLDAGGTVTLASSSFIDVRSANNGTPGGTVHLEGDVAVVSDGKIDASGSSGGTVVVSSPGTVELTQYIRSRGNTGAGGSITVTATGTVTTARRALDAQGVTNGGAITVSSTGADAVVLGNIGARGFTQVGGNVSITAATTLVLDRRIDVRGRTTGGIAQLGADDLQFMNRIRASATLQGGYISLLGDTVVLQGVRLEAQGNDVGGEVDATATTLVNFVSGTARVDGDQAGFFYVNAPAVNVGASADVDAAAGSSGTGGIVCLRATAGNMVLAGDFQARPAGTIEGAASGNLTAPGDFRTAPGGCISMAAGGTLDPTGGSFNPPFVADCGICP